jgi:hypothetical protein
MIKQRFNLFTHILLFEQEIRRDRQQAQINRSINQLFTSAQAEGFLQNSIIGTIATSLKKISAEEHSAKRPWYQLFSSRERPMQLAQAAQFAEALDRAMQVKSLYEIAHFQWPQIDKQLTILFPPQLLEAIDSINQISDTLDRVQENTAPLTKTTTMWEVSEQIVLLTRAQYALKELDAGFGQLLALVIGHFADVLKAEGERVRQEQQRGPVPNPYVIGNPVQGQLFVGREDVLRRLTELWGVKWPVSVGGALWSPSHGQVVGATKPAPSHAARAIGAGRLQLAAHWSGSLDGRAAACAVAEALRCGPQGRTWGRAARRAG